MENVPGPRPVVGASMHMVVIRDDSADVLSAVLNFDRGRGLVVDADEPPSSRFVKGDKVFLAYTAGDSIFAMRGEISEVISPKRVYVMALGPAVEMEKREYIRAIVAIRSALVVSAVPPDGDAVLVETSVELSASGFRWFGRASAVAGDTAWLCLDLEDGANARLVLQSVVVRAEPCGNSFEVAGRFVDIKPDARETIIDRVFRRRLSELGIKAGRSLDDDA